MSVGVAALEDKIPAERLPNHSGRLAWAEYSSRTLLSEIAVCLLDRKEVA